MPASSSPAGEIWQAEALSAAAVAAAIVQSTLEGAIPKVREGGGFSNSGDRTDLQNRL